MSEEADNGADGEQGKSSGALGKTIVLGIVVLVAAIGGMLTYMFVLAPLFEEKSPAVVSSEDGGEKIPPGAEYVEFDEKRASVKPEVADGSSAVLMYKISVLSANSATTALIEANRQLFEAKFDELHRGRTKTELADPQVLRSICRQAEQEGNSLLRRLQEEPNPEIRIIMVLHTTIATFDL
ncbi:MAG: hypothetical protein GWP08_04500 [Nitrospiraceae bacterium]|nr:hypothetical protein [Nitrospiraceae bacterium]